MELAGETMNQTQKLFTKAAFAKMLEGEPVSLADAQRVAEVWLNAGLNVDTANQEGYTQFVSQLKNMLHQRFFGK